jgi:cytosine/adenosine deaminase-related metal-dependent hydrolase
VVIEVGVAIQDGRIAAVGKDPGSAKTRADADGQVPAPGIIDLHSHFDATARRSQARIIQ